MLTGSSPDPRAAGAPLPSVADARALPVPGAPRLAIAPYDFAAAAALERELGISHALAQVLVRRGLQSPVAARAWLAAEDAHDPAAFAGIDQACALVLGHVRAGSRITVHGDYDVDGVCATAIAVAGLRRLGANVDWYLPSRADDGYGLSAATVQRLAARGTELLITVDCAITAVDEVAAARAAGLDVLVTDHHAPRADGARPDAQIVHPALCGYPCPDLCAAGVAHKLVAALATAAGEDPAGADVDLDLVALATVADLVALRGENRRLVRAGLRALAATAKPGLRALMRVARVDPSGLDAQAVAFRLAPRINAAGRLHRADAGLELVLTEDEDRARAVAAELDAANVQRRAVEQRILFEAEAQVAAAGDRSAHVLAGEGWHPGVIGIVAARVVERHHRPAVLIALDGDTGTGSGRSIPGFDLLAGLDAAAAHLVRHGGHRAAAGLTIGRGRVDAFRTAFQAHAAAAIGPADLVPEQRIDAVVGGGDLGAGLAEELARLEPCGAGNPGVTLLVPAATLAEPRPMGEGRHVRFSLRSGGARARGVAFGCGGRLPASTDQPVDAVLRLELDAWGGAVAPRVVLRDARPCTPAPIDVLGEPTDYLGAALAELDAPPAPWPPPVPAAGRELVDRRGEGVAAVLADLVAGGAPVLAVCADVGRREAGLGERVGGFALASHAALERDPGLTGPFAHVVALDPPAHANAEALLRAPCITGQRGHAHWAWGEAELGFAQRMHDAEHDLRASLGALYRALRAHGRAAGDDLVRLLAGDGGRPRSASLAGRLVRVLSELALVEVDRAGRAVAPAPAPPRSTALERSATFRAAELRLADGRRHLRDTGPLERAA